MLRRGADVLKLMATGSVFTHGIEPGGESRREYSRITPVCYDG